MNAIVPGWIMGLRSSCVVFRQKYGHGECDLQAGDGPWSLFMFVKFGFTRDDRYPLRH